MSSGAKHAQGEPAMNDLITTLEQLRRPRLLMRAARIGARDYRRKIHLPRLIGQSLPARSGPALMRLIDVEEDLNTARLNATDSYDMLRHIEVLIAIVAEARQLKADIAAAA
jgi:hypothetical protein